MIASATTHAPTKFRQRWSRDPSKRLKQRIDDIFERINAVVPGFVKEFSCPPDGTGSNQIYFYGSARGSDNDKHSITVELSTCENPARGIAVQLRDFGEVLLMAAEALEGDDMPGDDLEAACRVLLDDALECVCRCEHAITFDNAKRAAEFKRERKIRCDECACHDCHLTCHTGPALFRAEIGFGGRTEVAEGPDAATCIRRFQDDVIPFVTGYFKE